MTVRDLKARITSDEITDWLAYDRIFVPEGWEQHAKLCHLIASAVSSKPPRPEEFLPARYRPKPRPMTAAQIKAALRG